MNNKTQNKQLPNGNHITDTKILNNIRLVETKNDGWLIDSDVYTLINDILDNNKELVVEALRDHNRKERAMPVKGQIKCMKL